MDFVDDFEEAMKLAYFDWKNYGKCSEADYYNDGIQLENDKFDDCFPHFFTGDSNSEFVMVQLNPRRARDGKTKDFNRYHIKFDEIIDENQKNYFKSYDNYLQYFKEFGKRQYIETVGYKSTFDKNQLLFLLAFADFFGFKDGDSNTNLAFSIDKKLQLELVPFGSPDFNTAKVLKTCDLSKPLERILGFIAKHERKYVIFCSGEFEEILKLNPRFVKQYLPIEPFKLVKKDNSLTKNNYKIIKLVLNVDGKKIKAVIAPGYASKSLKGNLRTQYGEKIKAAFDEMNKSV
ncbi:MAG: hypothetical protein KBT11_10535 [Treponema sp.]|nr:hypothetical protein [Candidatus Treponema equifaecale]